MIGLLMIVAFLLLSPIFLLSASRFAPDPRSAREHSLAPILALFTLPLLALCLLWRVPLFSQHLVDSAVTSTTSPLNVNCKELNEALPTLERVGSGMIRIEAEGELLVNRELWRRTDPDNRKAIIELASKAQACLGASPKPILVRDLDSGEIIEAGRDDG